MTEREGTRRRLPTAGDTAEQQPRRGLLRRWTAIAVAARTADEALAAGAVLAVLAVHGQGGAAAVAATLTGSTALAGPVVGVVLDRSESVSALVRREVLGMCCLALAVCLFVLALAVGAPVLVLLLLAVVLGACAPVVGAGWSVVAVAITSPAEGEDRAPGASSPSVSDAAAYNVGGIVGPAVAGLLLALGPRGLLLLPPVLLGTAAAAGRLRGALARRGPLSSVTGDVSGSPHLVGQLVRGFRLLSTTARLRRTTIITTISYAGMGLTMVGLAVRADQLGEGPTGGGLLLSAVAVGALLGTALMAARRLAAAADGAVLLGTAGVGAGLATLAVMPTLASSAAVAVLVGLADGLLFTGMLRVRERDLPAAGRSSAYTSAATLKIAAFAAGAGSAGLAAGGQTILLAAAAVQGLALLAGFLAPRRRS